MSRSRKAVEPACEGYDKREPTFGDGNFHQLGLSVYALILSVSAILADTGGV